ncbi:Histidine kinase [Hymenobacter actinosclerus]|uniref:Histidine kinase n=1 Tax=Hymenobacter actinosclerus TaxID=82805 RepID=A0A1I0FDX5_9BACT|nr:Histidine kinase [Hymenobacter actinosclerus]
MLVGIPVLALVITLTTGSWHGHAFWDWRLVVDYSIALYFTAFLWLGNRWLWSWLLGQLPRVEQTSRRLWLLAAGSVLFTAAATLLLRLPLHGLLPQYFPLSWTEQQAAVLFNLIPTVVVQTLYETIFFFQKWQENVRRAEQLQSAGVQSQLEALQSQLDPHFLFNSLNTLSALIEPENEPAQDFVEQLADVYRYVLLAREQTTVPLAEELAFVDTYLALHKARFRDNLQVRTQVPAALHQRRVAPLSVQLLVENALKHNVASREQPLALHLSADAATGYFTVENTLRPRPAGLVPGTGTGLRNVRHRYELLQAPHPVTVTTEAGWFRVRLPLLGGER